MRIAIGGISHESSTFTPVQTTLASAGERLGYLRGAALFERFRDTNSQVGGFLDGARTHGFEPIPTALWEAHPGGPLPHADFTAILTDLVQRMQAAAPLDGVLLAMHGSMAVAPVAPEQAGAAGAPAAALDGDAAILAAIRGAVGDDVPVVAQLDIHANVSPAMVRSADVLIGRETYPEVDMAERARECADVLVRMVRDGLRPTMALCQLPMIWGRRQITAHPPMRAAIERLHQLERSSEVVCAFISTGYHLQDVPHMGSSVTVVTDGNRELAQQLADELGQWCYAERESWHEPWLSTREAIALARAQDAYPVVLADWIDNTGGGSPGDSTAMLRAFVDEELQDACLLYVVDPESVARCTAAGVGATLQLDIGGHSVPEQGPPVTVDSTVEAVSDGSFRYDGPMYAGLEASMGPSAHIRAGGVHVLLVSRREQPFDTAFARTLGLDPRTMRWVGVKSAGHFRSGFEPWAGAIYLVSEPGVHDLRHQRYRHLGRDVHPVVSRETDR